MQVLMFGWEFPPHISGGLGTACYGIASGLIAHGVDMLFVVPKLFGGEETGKFHFINASEMPIGVNVATLACAREQFRYLEVASPLLPYLSPVEFSAEAAGSRQRRSTAGGTPYRFAFTGEYGANLLAEVSRYAVVAATIAAQNEFDVIHAHDWLTYPAGIMAKDVSGKPLVVHVHATEFDRSGDNVNREVYALERRGLEAADAVIAVSNLTKRVLVERYGIAAEKITVVYNGLLSGEEYPHRYPHQSNGFKIVTYLGRVTFQKGPDYFVEAANNVLKKCPDVHFVMAGSGDMLRRMIKRVAELRIASRFHFTGFLGEEERDRLFAVSDVYVMPSVSEPFGLSALEAIRSGVPVVISKQAGVSEVLPNVAKVDFWDTDLLAETICELLNYKTLSTAFIRASGRDIESLTWEKAASKILSVYRSLIH